MLYSILIYDTEAVVEALPKEEKAARLEQHLALQAALRREGKLGTVARLMPTTTAVTLKREAGENMVLDGPFAETKEHLVGFYLIECDSLAAAIEAAQNLSFDSGALEIRPVGWIDHGQLRPEA